MAVVTEKPKFSGTTFTGVHPPTYPDIVRNLPKVLRIAIVGADGRKWEGDQKQKMEEYIEMQLFGLLHRKEIIVGGIGFLQIKNVPNKWNDIYRERNPEDWILYNATCKSVEFDKLIIVSGHCSVGKEKRFCIDCNEWLPEIGNNLSGWNTVIEHSGHKLIKVYDQGGVDIRAEIIATKFGIKTEIFPSVCTNKVFIKNGHDEVKHDFKVPSGHYWNYHYKPRNIDMAKSDIVIDIEPARKCRYCGGKGLKLLKKQKFVHFQGRDGNIPINQAIPETCKYCEGDGAYSGGTWTYKDARKRGKEVYKIIIK